MTNADRDEITKAIKALHDYNPVLDRYVFGVNIIELTKDEVYFTNKNTKVKESIEYRLDDILCSKSNKLAWPFYLTYYRPIWYIHNTQRIHNYVLHLFSDVLEPVGKNEWHHRDCEKLKIKFNGSKYHINDKSDDQDNAAWTRSNVLRKIAELYERD